MATFKQPQKHYSKRPHEVLWMGIFINKKYNNDELAWDRYYAFMMYISHFLWTNRIGANVGNCNGKPFPGEDWGFTNEFEILLAEKEKVEAQIQIQIQNFNLEGGVKVEFSPETFKTNLKVHWDDKPFIWYFYN